jgi:hypothetical protein
LHERRRGNSAADGRTDARRPDARAERRSQRTRALPLDAARVARPPRDVRALGLLNVFGQRPATSRAAAPAAELSVYAPERVRSGLYFDARFHVRAIRELEDATLVLDPGWREGMTLNTVEPAPVGEESRDGALALELGRIPGGSEHLLFLQFQVNPTNVGHHSHDVDLYDGEEQLVSIDRTITVWL